MTRAEPVLIVGAGPVGLSLALWLLQRGVDVRVLEREARLPSHSNLVTIHPPTMEMLHRGGALDACLKESLRVSEVQFWDQTKKEMTARLSYDAIDQDTAFPFRLLCPLSALTRALADGIRAIAPDAIQTGCEFREVRETEDGVSAQLTTSAGEVEMSGRYLVGADGADSKVRQALGVEFAGLVYEHGFLLVEGDLELDRYFPDIGPVAYMYGAESPATVMRSDAKWLVVFPLRRDENHAETQDEARVAERMAGLVGADAGPKVEHVSIYRVSQRLARQFRVGRVLLAGDAAHCHGDPAEGIGLNSGLHDAYHLAQAFQAVYAGGPDPQRLDDYAGTRRRIALDLVQKAANAHYNNFTKNVYPLQTEGLRVAAIASSRATTRTYLLHASLMEPAVTSLSPESLTNRTTAERGG